MPDLLETMQAALPGSEPRKKRLDSSLVTASSLSTSGTELVNAHEWLDARRIPRSSEDDEEYTLLGRLIMLVEELRGGQRPEPVGEVIRCPLCRHRTTEPGQVICVVCMGIVVCPNCDNGHMRIIPGTTPDVGIVLSVGRYACGECRQTGPVESLRTR